MGKSSYWGTQDIQWNHCWSCTWSANRWRHPGYVYSERKPTDILHWLLSHIFNFEPHYRTYVLDNFSFSSKLIYHSSLFIHNSVHVHTSCVPDLSPHFVILPYALCVPVWFCKLFDYLYPMHNIIFKSCWEFVHACMEHIHIHKSTPVHVVCMWPGLWEQAYRVYGHKLYTLYITEQDTSQESVLEYNN